MSYGIKVTQYMLVRTKKDADYAVMHLEGQRTNKVIEVKEIS